MNPKPGKDEVLQPRRSFLRRVLRTGAYIPPAVVAMSMRNVAVAQATCPVNGSCGGGGGCNGGGKGCTP